MDNDSHMWNQSGPDDVSSFTTGAVLRARGRLKVPVRRHAPHQNDGNASELQQITNSYQMPISVGVTSFVKRNAYCLCGHASTESSILSPLEAAFWDIQGQHGQKETTCGRTFTNTITHQSNGTRRHCSRSCSATNKNRKTETLAQAKTKHGFRYCRPPTAFRCVAQQRRSNQGIRTKGGTRATPRRVR